MFRRPFRRAMRRGMMRRRFMWRRAPWGRFAPMRTGMLFMMGAAAYKISQPDAQRITQETGRDFDSLTEADLIAAMKNLGIRQLSLDEEDREAIAEADEA